MRQASLDRRLQGVNDGMLRVYFAALSEDRSSGLVSFPIQAGAFILAASCLECSTARVCDPHPRYLIHVRASEDALSLSVRTASPHKSDDLLDRESMRPHAGKPCCKAVSAAKARVR